MPRGRSNDSGARREERRDRERKAFLLRLSPELMAELRRWAGAELRSLNAHIEYLLRAAVRERRGRGSRADSE